MHTAEALNNYSIVVGGFVYVVVLIMRAERKKERKKERKSYSLVSAMYVGVQNNTIQYMRL